MIHINMSRKVGGNIFFTKVGIVLLCYQYLKNNIYRMLELFSIFTKGGIVLFCFQGACTQLISSTHAVNESIKNILIQVRSTFTTLSIRNLCFVTSELFKVTSS